MKKDNEYGSYNLILIATMFGVFVIGILLGISLTMDNFYVDKDIKPIFVSSSDNLNINELNTTINMISDRCGSTHLVKKYGEERWSVFRQYCHSDGACGYDYVPLEECIVEGLSNK